MSKRYSPCVWPACRPIVLALIAVFVWVAFGTSADAQSQPGAREQGGGEAAQQPRIADKGLGEEEEIRLRSEWFFSTRRAGTTSELELWSLRLAGVEATRDAIRLQQAQQAATEGGGGPEQNVWYEMGPSPSTFGNWAFGNVSGRIQAIAADWAGGILYAGAASGGVWKSTNDGLSWTNIFHDAGTVAVGAIEVDPNDPNVLWVGTGDNIVSCESYFGIGLLRSPDGGATWELRNGSGEDTLEDLASFASVTVDPRDSNKIVVGGRYRNCANGSQETGGIYSTDDGGLTWSSRLANTQIHEIARNPVVLDILWASTNGGVYKSTDNGQTWILQTASGLPAGALSRTEIAIAPSDPDTVYVLYDTPSDEFWRTTNNGASWTMMDSDACDGQCWYNMVLRVDAEDPDTVYRGTIKPFRTTNGGSSWTQLTSGWGSGQTLHQDIQSMLAHPTDGGTVYIGSDGGLWKTENYGNTFTNLNGNMNVTQFYAIGVDAQDPQRICGGAQDNSSLARTTSNVWDRQAVTGDGFVCHINPVDSNYAFITSYPFQGYPNVWRSTSGLFGSWTDITGAGSGVIGGDRSNWVTPYELDPTSPNILYLGTHRAYKSTNHGSSWTQVGPSDLTGGGSASLFSLEVSRNFPSVVYSGSVDGKVWRSTNGGTNWHDLSPGLPARSINDIEGDPTNPDRAFVVLGGFNTSHLWEWNVATGWTEHDGGLPNVPANAIVMFSDLDMLVGTDVGVFRSEDGGQSFFPYMEGLPIGLVVTDLKYTESESLVSAGTYGRGAWQVNVGPPAPSLIAESVVQPLIQVDGDGDTEIEPGETWSVQPILRNTGGSTAEGVIATLATPTVGVTITNPDAGSFGDLGPGQAGPVITPFEFIIDPSFACGSAIDFDLVEIGSTEPPTVYDDQLAFHAELVQDGNEPPITTTLFEEDFDPEPTEGWEHEVVSVIGVCAGVIWVDEWNIDSKDAPHGQSFHCGNGPGGTYSSSNNAWLHPFGKDSEDGDGLVIPAEAIGATLTIVHWYDTAFGEDGGQVALDITQDGEDIYTTLQPDGGYPGTLATLGCNALGGQEAFQGSSGGWVTNIFNLTPYRGSRVFPAFVFGSDVDGGTGEGWYIDDVRVDYEVLGAPICQVSQWPGVVPDMVLNLVGGDIEATWDDSCNIAEFPGQTYSIQAGDLAALAASGSYTHAPIGGLCDLTSPETFTPGAGDEYYLIVPAGDGREGGAGADSTGLDRPQPGAGCGLRRVSCP